MEVKICGIKYRENLLEIINLPSKPEYLGFIFYPKSPRYMVDTLNTDDLKSIPKTIKKIGVFVNKEANEIMEIADKYKLDGIQLHGDESVEHMQLFNKYEGTIIKAFGVNDSFNFDLIKEYIPYVDFFLFDTKTKQYGGSGNKFNWEILQKYPYDIPYFLSGGIGAKEYREAQQLNLPLLSVIDMNSRLEMSPGLKDIEKIKEIWE